MKQPYVYLPYRELPLLSFVFIALSVKKRRPEHNRWAFGTMAIIIIISSALLIGSVMDNFLQATPQGITRQSLEVEYWVCGVEVDLRDPVSPNQSSIGSGSYFEAGDKVARFQGLVGADLNHRISQVFKAQLADYSQQMK